jgi:hypothetical protein
MIIAFTLVSVSQSLSSVLEDYSRLGLGTYKNTYI